MSITINEATRHYVIAGQDFYTTMGFDFVYRELKNLEVKLGKFSIDIGAISEEEIGSKRQYEQYRNACKRIGQHDIGTWYDLDTPFKVQRVLEAYRKSGKQIRIFYGDCKSGRDWMEEYAVIGCVGRSVGPMKIPLLVEKGESGGDAIQDRCIVRMMDVETRKELYKQANYYLPEMEIRRCYVGKPNTHGVWGDGMKLAAFPSIGKAAQWIAFMSGEGMEKPK